MTMRASIEKTVLDLALENAVATPVFERFQIDYCCGGGKSLEDACRVAGVEPARVIEAIESEAAGGGDARDWSGARLGELIDFIRDTHHAYTREAIERIPRLTEKVVAAHGANHPEMRRIQAVFGGVAEELAM